MALEMARWNLSGKGWSAADHLLVNMVPYPLVFALLNLAPCIFFKENPKN